MCYVSMYMYIYIYIYIYAGLAREATIKRARVCVCVCVVCDHTTDTNKMIINNSNNQHDKCNNNSNINK